MNQEGNTQNKPPFFLREKKKILSSCFRYLTAILILISLNLFPNSEAEIVVLVSSTNALYMKGITGFQSSYKGKSKVVFLQDIQTRDEEEKNFFEEYENSKKPFIVTFGKEATNAAIAELRDTPILFSFVNSSRTLFETKENLCGYDLEIPIEEYFKVLKEIKPEAKKVYSIYSTNQAKYMILEGEYEDIYQELILNSSSVTSNEEFAETFATLIEGSDAFLLVPDPVYGEENFSAISEYCKKNGIILMAYFPALVDLGATFAIIPDYTSVGEQTGKLGSNILEKKTKCHIGPVAVPESRRLYLNQAYAKSSGIQIPVTVLNKVEADKLMSLGIDLYYKGLYQSASNAFSKLLKADATNESAKYYQKKIRYILNKDEFDKMNLQAETAWMKKEYKKAADYYGKILQIYPENNEIKERYNNAILSESEEIRTQATALYKKADIFNSIRKYLEATKVFPTNTKAKEELATLRRIENGKTNNYIQEGLAAYNARKYPKSIEIFDNVLLLDPDNKIATEYLRLSRLKKESYEKLIKCRKEKLVGCELLK
ncbi:MAG: hypothetical protein KBA66_17440 [Leptospiraceae bacterium]|nr:hypothetical protein [Leptospiraceae bacterium]